MPQYIGVDLGGTQIRSALLDEDLNLLNRYNTLTKDEEGFEPTMQRIKESIRKVMPDDESQVEAIGISAPGPLNPRTGVIVAPPNLAGWHNVPLRDKIAEEFSCDIYVGNDANVAGLAEVAKGAAQGYRHAIYLTVSTGIGSGMIVNGKMLLGHEGLAAEAGHVVIISDEGRVSSLEKEASGPNIARQVRERIEQGETSQVEDMVDGDLNNLDARIVGQAAQAGDEVCKAVVTRAGRIIGLGIVSLLHLFNPEIVVIGGGVSKMGDLLFNPIWDTVKQHAMDSAYWENLQIVPAGLGDDVGLVGAGALALTKGGQEDVTELIAELND